MTKTRQKSKKDVAFEQERAKFRHQIRDLEREVKNQKIRILELEIQLEKKDVEIEELKEWNERLLGYMDLSEEEMKKMIKAEKARSRLINDYGFASSVFSSLLSNRF